MYGIDYPNDLVDAIYKLNTDLILNSILKVRSPCGYRRTRDFG